MTLGLRTDMIGSEGARAGALSTSTVAGAAIKGQRAIRPRPWLGIVLAAAAGSTAWAAEVECSTPSGLPVPRYVSIKVDPARARAGPSEDHRVLWVYHARGMPVQVVAETAQWRRICDPEGGLAWVHSRVIDGRRTVMQTQVQPIPLRAAPQAQARVRAYMAPRSIGGLDRCKDGWCKVKVGRIEGWTPEATVWGAKPAAQCLRRPAAN
jgi:SH3-like domain-containing protein